MTAVTALFFAAVLAVGGASVAAADHYDNSTGANVSEWPTADDENCSVGIPDDDSANEEVGDDDSSDDGAGDGDSRDDDDASDDDSSDEDDGEEDSNDDGAGDDDSSDNSGDDDAGDDESNGDNAGEDGLSDDSSDDSDDNDPNDDDSSDDNSSDGDSGDGENDTNAQPESVITAPDGADAGESIVLSAVGSTDDGSIQSYEWTLGDDSTATGENVSHAYDTTGNYTVTLTVVDDEGATDNATATIRVENSSGDDGFDEREVERLIHEQINEIRESEGLDPLNHDEALRSIAHGHSEDMAVNDYFSHTSPDGDGFGDRYDEAGYECSLGGGENIAMRGVFGEPSEEDLANQFVDMWMNSDGHRQNILTDRWNNEGIGVYYDEADGEVYATQNFC